jgi:hypothetical protein
VGVLTHPGIIRLLSNAIANDSGEPDVYAPEAEEDGMAQIPTDTFPSIDLAVTAGLTANFWILLGKKRFAQNASERVARCLHAILARDDSTNISGQIRVRQWCRSQRDALLFSPIDSKSSTRSKLLSDPLFLLLFTSYPCNENYCRFQIIRCLAVDDFLSECTNSIEKSSFPDAALTKAREGKGIAGRTLSSGG